MRIELLIPGDPVGKGRPRVTRHGTFTPRRTKDYERKIFECWREQSGLTFPDDVPLKMRIEAFFKITKSYSKGKRERIRGTPFFHSPDADNVMVVRFEDLIRNYDEESKRIMAFVGFNENKHNKPNEYLKPEVSAKNIGVWRQYYDKYKDAIDAIAEMLPEYCVSD